MDLVFENAVLEDAPMLIDMINVAYEVETGDTGVAFKNSVRVKPGFESIVMDPIKSNTMIKAMCGGECVGCVVWEERDESLYFGPLAIKVGCQKQGIGKKLIAHLEQLCREMGKLKLDMIVVNHRTDLIPMYEHMGFIRTGVEKPYYEPKYLTRDSHFVFFSKPISA